MMCARTEEEARRARARGRQLLRLLARPLLRLRRPRARQDRRVGGVHRAARRAGLLPRHRGRARGGAPRRQGRQPATPPGCGAPPARPTRSASTCARYEEAGVDQLIFVMQAGKNRHEHICEAIELFGTRGAAGVQGARRGPGERPRPKRLAPVIEAAMARKDAHAPDAARGLLVPGHAPEDGRRLGQRAGQGVAREVRRVVRHRRHGGLRPDHPVARRMAYTVISLDPRRSSVSSTMTPNSTSVPPSR